MIEKGNKKSEKTESKGRLDKRLTLRKRKTKKEKEQKIKEWEEKRE